MSVDVTIPVDDTALNLILEAMRTAYTCDEHGNHTLVGGTITLNQLLNFWSGYDKTLEQAEGDNLTYYPNPVLHERDIIRALINEIRRLRGNDA